MIFRKKKRDKGVTVAEVSARIRGFMYDSQVADAEHISMILGCSTLSEEVEDKEIEESDFRVSQVQHLIPVMYAYAHAMAEGVVEHQREHLEDDEDASESFDVPNAAWTSTRKVFTQIAMNSVLGAISQLVDMGYLKVTSPKGKARK